MESDITAEEETLYKRRRRQSLELISSGNQALGEQINICVIIMMMYQMIIHFFPFRRLGLVGYIIYYNIYYHTIFIIPWINQNINVAFSKYELPIA